VICYRHEPTVVASGCRLTAVVRISLTKHAQIGRWLVAGDKRPIVVICDTEGGEHIFDMDGRQIDAIELKDLMTDQQESSVGSFEN
jgi:hypothetical protein